MEASPLVVSARRFSRALRKALDDQGRLQRDVCAEIGIGRSRMGNWLSGSAMPSQEMADRLADVLCAPALAELVAEARRRPCDNCGKTFVAAEHSPARYCSMFCRRNQVKQVEGRRDLSRSVLQRRVALLDHAVAAMCSACEPLGTCRTPDCPLQAAGVSPNRLEASA